MTDVETVARARTGARRMSELERLKADRDAALADCDRLFSATLADFRAVLDAKMFATRAEIYDAFDAALAAQAKEQDA